MEISELERNEELSTEELDSIIDPDENLEALAEAQGAEIKEEVTILTLLTKNSAGFNHRIKVRYRPQSIAASLEFDHGTPVTPPGTRRPTFNYDKWVKEALPKMNALALLNVDIVNDLNSKAVLGPKSIRLSAISPGEFRRLNDLCFPGQAEDTDDSANENNVPRRKGGKGARIR